MGRRGNDDTDKHPERQPVVNQVYQSKEIAFESLFREQYEVLRSLASLYIREPEIVEDILQDVFTDVWKQWDSIELRGEIGAYMRGAVRHRSLNHLRRERLERQWVIRDNTADDSSTQVPERDLRQKELKQAIEEALNTLPEKRRIIYNLSRQHGLSYAEIAVVLNISVKTVETQMGRALRFLRKQLAGFFSVLF